MGTQQNLSELDSMKGGAFRSYRYATINRSWAGWQATLAGVRALPERGGTNKSGLSNRSLPMQRFFFVLSIVKSSSVSSISFLRFSSSFYVHSSILCSLFKFSRSLLNSICSQYNPFAPSSSLFSPVSISLSLSLSLSAENNFSRSRRFCRMFCPLGSVNKTRSLVNRFS